MSRELHHNEEAELRKNPINVFTCLDCVNSKGLEFTEFKTHLKSVHKINTDDRDQLKGNRKMLMHLDGDYWFSSSYEWTLENGLKFSQYCENAREKDDPMRFC